jgi:hypothetical protein
MYRSELPGLVFPAFVGTPDPGRALVVLLAIATKARERHYLETRFHDFETAILADPIFLFGDPLKRSIYLAKLNSLALREPGT